MKVILPVAGKGTRLLPVTKSVPKPLVRVAGRPVLDYVMEKLTGLEVEELIFITGHLKDQVEQYVTDTYDFPARFVEQKVQDGTAGAVNLARPYIDCPVMIIFVDTIFDADLSMVNRTNADGIIWAKEVEDYQRFGVVVTDYHGYMVRIVEKPSEPISRLANIGLYYVQDWQCMFEGIAATLSGTKTKGEWFLTDAFQYMIDSGRKLLTAHVDGWYDCGKVETLLETNLHVLETGGARIPEVSEGVEIVEPVYIADRVELGDCTVGPNVSIDEDTVVQGSRLTNVIVGRNGRIYGSKIEQSLLGDDVECSGEELVRMVVAKDESGRAP
ncbi:MAG: sugar phosphate nucleotidyltransferase [Gemmatimonadales bacterium]